MTTTQVHSPGRATGERNRPGLLDGAWHVAAAELRMLYRNLMVATAAFLVPALFAVVLITVKKVLDGPGMLAGMQAICIAALGSYVTVCTTMAARRQNLYLKRLRSTTLSDVGIVLGLSVPVALVNLVQICIVLAVVAAVTDLPPSNPVLVVVALLLAEVFFVVAALATLGITDSPEHAQVTTLPLFFVVLGASMWIGLLGTAEHEWVKLALPGGALTEAIRIAWDGADLARFGLCATISLVWTAAAAILARALFRWEPRH